MGILQVQRRREVRANGNVGAVCAVVIAMRVLFCALVGGLVLAGCAPTKAERRAISIWGHFDENIVPPVPLPPIKPARTSEPLPGKVGDLAIWSHPTNPWESIVFVLDERASGGGLFALDMFGGIRTRWTEMGQPVDVSIEQGVRVGKAKLDLLLLLDAGTLQTRIYSIDPGRGELHDRTGQTRVLLDDEHGDGKPIAMDSYRRADGTVSVFITREIADSGNAVWEYRLVRNGQKFDLEKVREFGDSRGMESIRALLVDDPNGYVYYADKYAGIRKYVAEAQLKFSHVEVKTFARSGWEGTVVELGVHEGDDAHAGVIVGLDSRYSGAALLMFDRIGASPTVHDHQVRGRPYTLAVKKPGGMALTARPTGTPYPEGFFVVSDQNDNRVKYFSWKRLRVQLEEFEAHLLRVKTREMNRLRGGD